MSKTYNGPYGHTYYYREGVLVGCPTNSDDTCDMDEMSETSVDEFAEPLTPEELADVTAHLQ